MLSNRYSQHLWYKDCVINLRVFLKMQEKKKASLVLSILSIIFAFGFPVFSIIFGVFGLVLTNSYQKESGL